MTYRNIVKVINWLIKVANTIRMIQCKNKGDCLCPHCNNTKCKNRDVHIDALINPADVINDSLNE